MASVGPLMRGGRSRPARRRAGGAVCGRVGPESDYVDGIMTAVAAGKTSVAAVL
jgi:hypothetical protein